MDAELVDVPEVVEVAEARRPGRPRSAEADEAILEAAVELFAEVGLESLTIEGVAARAGVGKATIYRRYPCKVDLVVAAARCFTQGPVLPPDTGSTRGDLRELVDGLIDDPHRPHRSGGCSRSWSRRAPGSPELDRAYADIVAEKRARSMIVVRRAIERGDLRPDVDPELVIDSYVSPIFYRFLVTNAAARRGVRRRHSSTPPFGPSAASAAVHDSRR